MENDYIMSSVEIDMDFIDRKADEYEESYQMSDEEQKGFEEHITEEEEEVEIEPCDDPLINNLFDSYSGDKTSETDRVEDIKRAKQVVLPTYKGVVNRIEENANRLANHFNHQGVK